MFNLLQKNALVENPAIERKAFNAKYERQEKKQLKSKYSKDNQELINMKWTKQFRSHNWFLLYFICFIISLFMCANNGTGTVCGTNIEAIKTEGASEIVKRTSRGKRKITTNFPVNWNSCKMLNVISPCVFVFFSEVCVSSQCGGDILLALLSVCVYTAVNEQTVNAVHSFFPSFLLFMFTHFKSLIPLFSSFSNPIFIAIALIFHFICA